MNRKYVVMALAVVLLFGLGAGAALAKAPGEYKMVLVLPDRSTIRAGTRPTMRGFRR